MRLLSTYLFFIEVVTDINFSKPLRLLEMSIFLSHWGCFPDTKLYFSRPLRLLWILILLHSVWFLFPSSLFSFSFWCSMHVIVHVPRCTFNYCGSERLLHNTLQTHPYHLLYWCMYLLQWNIPLLLTEVIKRDTCTIFTDTQLHACVHCKSMVAPTPLVAGL